MLGINGIEEKYKILKDQITSIGKLLEDEQKSKELVQKKHLEDFKLLETKIKIYLSEEREVNGFIYRILKILLIKYIKK